jgi:hypothetical protein
MSYSEIKSPAELRAWAFELAREEGASVEVNLAAAEKLLDWLKKPYMSPSFAAEKAQGE